jgi:hypothetical protein
VEPTVSELQAQIDRLSLVVQQRRDPSGHLEPMAQGLSQLAERCTEILNRWADTDERHSRAVSEVEARLGEWSAIEGRLHQDAAERMRELENTIGHEWQALRHIHEEPVKQLREQAAALGEVCVSAANLALQGFERAEARLTALEVNLQERLSELSRDVHTALVARRDETRLAPLAPVAPFPLDGVMRIHEELRESTPAADLGPTSHDTTAGPASGSTAGPATTPPVPEAAAALSARVESLEREVTSERQEVRDTATLAERLRRDWRLALGVLGAVLVGAAVLGVMLQRRVNARLDEAATQVAAAERQAQTASEAASRQIASTRADAERQIAEAHQASVKAELVSNVLAAPDLIRFNLVGTDQASGASGQVLWSRSRGLVLSASHLPQVAAGQTYQMWLLTPTASVSAGLFVPDSAGRATLAAENPPDLPHPVTGVSVTLEAAGGQQSPSGVTVLARAPQ